MTASTRSGVLLVVLLVAAILRLHALDRYPVGISADEAINVIDVFHIVSTGSFPMYEEDEGRAEPLYRILLAAGAFFLGNHVWTLRVMSGWLGVLSIAAVGWLLREVLADLSPRARFLGVLVGMMALAVMLGHLTLSRALFRANLQILCVAMSAAFALRTLRLARWRDALAWGAWSGTTLYTYTSAWVYPLAFAGLGATLLLTQRTAWRVWLPRALAAAGAALLVAAPVLYLVVTDPRSVFGRAQALVGAPPTLWQALEIVHYHLFEGGDVNPQYNVAHAPLLAPLWQPLFVLGLAMLVWRWRARASLFLLAMLVVFQVPALVSNEPVHGLRVAHVQPVLAVIIGAGMGAAVQRVRWRMRRFALAIGALLSVLFWQAIGAWQTYRAYWDMPESWMTWYIHGEQLDNNTWFFRTDQRDLARWIVAQDTPLLMPSDALGFQTLRVWLVTRFPHVRAVDSMPMLPTNTRLLLPYALELGDLWRKTRDYALLQGDAITLLPPLDDAAHARLLADLEGAQRLERAGQLPFLGVVKPLEAGLALSSAPLHASDVPLADFGDGELLVLGWYGADTLAAGQTQLTVTPLLGTTRSRLGHEYAAYVQLQTQDYQRLANTEGLLLRWLHPTTRWRAGERVPVSFALDLPPDLPTGAYRLVMGVYYSHRMYLPAVSYVADSQLKSATIAWVKVPPPPSRLPADLPRLDVQFGEHLVLLAAAQERTQDGLRVRLYWQARTHRPPLDTTLFVHLLDAQGGMLAQQDTRPLGGAYPTFVWDEGELVVTEHALPTPPDGYRLRVGAYTLPYTSNLPASRDGQPLPDNALLLDDTR